MVIAMYWVHQITTVSLEMVLPGALGYWLDHRWGTAPWLLVVGVVLGFVTSMIHLLRMVETTGKSRRQSDSNKDRCDS